MIEASDRVREAEDLGPEELAAEYLAQKAAGGSGDPHPFLVRLADDAARRKFQDLVDDAAAAERGLPRTISRGSVLAGRYRILEAIGSGGMGRVFSAFDENLGREIAVKVLAPLTEGNREREEMFRKESRLLADLSHPGIVAVHDAGRDGAYTYIVMDLVEGTALSEVLDRARKELERSASGTPLPSRDGWLLARAIGRHTPEGRPEIVEASDWYRSCARILLELARTLEAAHARKVVHRDLKPANVMLLGGGSPIVLDFGLAGSPDVSTGGVTEGLYGSVAYLAPEQAKSQKVGMDPRTDVYQLGLILYEMLTLRRAFPGTAIGEVLEHIEQGFFDAPRKIDPRVPRDLQAICTMALEVSPDRRYASARALREDLERWLEGRAPIASRSARWRSLVRTARYTAQRHPVASAAAAMLAMGAIAFWPRTSPPPPPAQALGSFKKFHLNEVVALPDRDGEVHVGDSLLFTVKSTGPTHVYALSVFGQDQARFVCPWRPVLPDAPKGQEQPGTPWGLRVGSEKPGETDVLCTTIENADNHYEGLLVLTSPEARAELDGWMQDLFDERGETGVPLDRALRMLDSRFAPSRGVSRHSWSEPEREAIRAAIQKAREPGHQLDLPGVEEFSIECTVAKP